MTDTDQPTPPSPLPQVRLRPYDRWAHRRGEPRTLAAVWILYLFGATVISVGAVGAIGLLSADVYRPAARILLEIVAIGVSILWPMVRLSQEPPSRPLAAIAQDIFVIVGPIQAIIWPQALTWMANWSLPVILCLNALICGWTFLIGGLLAAYFSSIPGTPPQPDSHIDYTTPGTHAQLPLQATSRPILPRWAMMSLILIVVLLGPLVAVLTSSTPRAGIYDPATVPSNTEWLMTSPLTAIYEITIDRSWTGQWAAVDARHWAGVGLAWGASVIAWGAAAVTAATMKRRHVAISHSAA